MTDKTDQLRHYALRALIAWDGTVLPKSHDGLMQERMEDLRAALAAAPQPARVALPADLIEYMRKHLDHQRGMLVGFTKLDNERRRAAKLDDWIAAVAGIPGTDGAA